MMSYEDFEFENQIELQVEGMQIRRNKSQSKIHTIEYWPLNSQFILF